MQYLSHFDPKDMSVLVRLDLDLPFEKGKFDTTRLEDGAATLTYLRKQKARHVTVIAHRGHDVKRTEQFSLDPIAKLLYKHLLTIKAFQNLPQTELEEWLDVYENLRFDPREEAGDLAFAKELATGHDLFVNDAFATSHREHTSIVMLPKVLNTVFGFQFEKEMVAMKKITETPKRPFIFVLGGAKLETKMPLLEKMSDLADVVLLGGKLALEAQKTGYKNRKTIIANLTEDTLDIVLPTIEQFERFIAEAKTLVWNGPMGKFEDKASQEGTKRIAEAIARTTGYKMIGGGDTEAALTMFGLSDSSFNHVSSGGGAMLHYLTYRTLPGIDAAATVK